MKIIKLIAENVKRLKAVEITPKENMVVISGRNDQGKQQPISEPVLTPKGWRPIGELKIGEYVIGSDGKPTEIVGVYPQKERKIFKVKMVDGASTRCGPEHLWNVLSWKSVSGNMVLLPDIISTTDLLTKGLRRGSARKWSIPIVAPIEFSDSREELPICPYALGIILGDGHIEPTGYVTITSGDSEIFDTLNVNGWHTERELGTGTWSRPLRHLGLAGKRSYDKFIPEIYQYAGIEDRKLLFFGLMDADGTCEASWASYCSTSERLVDDFVRLGSSLGYLCKKRKGSIKKYRYNGELKEGRMAWYILVKSTEAPFALKRKISNWSPSIVQPAKRFIDTITRVNNEDSVCIKVAAEDGLYVTKDFILTHNTSVLDSIWFALGGGESLKETPMPIREGQEKAEVRVDLGDMIVTRRWTSNERSYLQVENKEGLIYKSPQQLIDGFIGKLTFDPLEFSRLSASEQRKLLLKILNVDLTEIEKERDFFYQERTLKGRELKTAQARIKEMIEDIPEEEISISALSEELEQQIEHNKKVEEVKRKIEIDYKKISTNDQNIASEKNKINALTNEIKELEEDIRVRFEDIEQFKEYIKEEQEFLKENSVIDTRITRDKIQEAEIINRKIRQNQENEKQKEAVKVFKDEYSSLTQSLEQNETAKKEILQKARMPIENLGIGPNGVTYRNIPFSQLSSSEQIKVSLSIAMALNPKLKVIEIRDGSLLDDESMEIIKKTAEENDYQMWIERREKGEVSFLIEDGELVN